MRDGHSLKVWTKKQQVVPLSTGESELDAAVKTASECLEIQSGEKDLGIVCGLNPHLDAAETTCLINCGGLGKANTLISRSCGYKRPRSLEISSRRNRVRA